MDAADLGVAGGMCAVGLLAEPDPEGQRDAGDPLGAADRPVAGFYHNTLFTQVALRSLAFVDRYN